MAVGLYFLCILDDIPISNDSGYRSSSDSGAIIGGLVGGVILLLMITVVLCIVILCMRRKGTFPVDDKLDNTIKPEDSKAASEDEYVQFNQDLHLEYTIKMDTNPSYGVTTGGDRATGSSAHSNTKATTKQYDYDYVCEDRLLHLNTTASTTGEAKRYSCLC